MTATERDHVTAAVLRVTLCAILLEAARQLTMTKVAKPTRAMRAAIDFMDQHHAEPLRMGTVARAADCCRARLFQNFKDSTGMTPNDFLQRLRINRVQAALASTDESITTIALRAGFSSSQYFSTVFRKYSGVTPNQFRVRHRNPPRRSTLKSALRA